MAALNWRRRLTRLVASADVVRVTGAVDCEPSIIRAAIVLRYDRSTVAAGRLSVEAPGAESRCPTPRDAAAERTSLSRMRPFRPVPEIPFQSTPSSAATRAARGEIRTRRSDRCSSLILVEAELGKPGVEAGRSPGGVRSGIG